MLWGLAIEAKRAVQREGLRHGELLAGNKRDVLSGGRSKWFDDQQRLDTQHALCLALSGDFSKAFRRLNEAEATLIELPESRGMEQAIIDLHRAAIFQLQAAERSRKILEPLFSCFYKNDFAGLEMWEAATETMSGIKGTVEENLDSIGLALLDDSLQALDRAKPILKQNRKNAWWTTWNFELRMKVIESDLRASLSSYPRKSLPYIGAQAAPSSLPTELDGLLDNSRRMIRMDLYRLARIVECYGNCLLMLGIWRWDVLSTYEQSIDSDLIDRIPNSNLVLEALQLHSREESMLKWLANENVESGRYTKVLGATHVLEKLMLARRALDAEEKKTVLNEDVSTFVSNVIGFSKRVARFTTKNLERTKSVSIVPPKF